MKKITDYAEFVKAKHALNKTIAPVEDGANIAGSYTSGKQFIRDSVLYSALTSIAAGTAWSSLTLDTDYEVADDVSTQIAAVNQTLTNYANSQRNPNLLDNPFFTVNQRGQSSYSLTENGMTADRWAASVSAGTMIVGVSSNGLTITEASDVGDGGLIERINEPTLLGKTVTISIDDGTNIYHATGTIPSVQPANWTSVCEVITSGGIDAALFIAPVDVTAFQLQYVIRVPKDNTAYTVRAVKLELGTVSTLAHDTAPNYQQELAKCQRYFVRLKKTNNLWPLVYGFVYALETNVFYFSGYVTLPTTMRAIPTISYPDITHWSVVNYAVDLSVHDFDANSSITIGVMDNLNILSLRIAAVGTGIDSNIQLNQALLLVANTSTYLDLSADL